ncbi:MAG: hypothetical protein ACLTBV_16530 [Enterocloster bolteae]
MDFLPNHLKLEEFPFTMEEIKKYDCVILSVIWDQHAAASGPHFYPGAKRCLTGQS